MHSKHLLVAMYLKCLNKVVWYKYLPELILHDCIPKQKGIQKQDNVITFIAFCLRALKCKSFIIYENDNTHWLLLKKRPFFLVMIFRASLSGRDDFIPSGSLD